MSHRVRVVIIEDETDLRALIERELLTVEIFQVVGAAGTLSDASSLLETEFDLALVDLALADGESFDLIRTISSNAGRKVLVLSAMDDARSVLDAFSYGASGYVLKSAPGFEIAEAALTTLDGGVVISPAIARFLLHSLPARRPGRLPFPRRSGLSDREQQVLTAVANGLTRKEIARELHLSPYTVAEYLSNIYKKYMVSNKSAAVAKAIWHNDIAG